MKRVVLLSLALFGCTAPADDVVLSRQYPAEYTALAACAYTRLDAENPAMMRMVELRATNSIRLTQESDGIRYWEATIAATGAQSSSLAIKSLPTLRGRDHFAQQVVPVFDACATSITGEPPARRTHPRRG